MWSDGDWLKGESNVFKNEKGILKSAWETSGLGNENLRGIVIKNIPAVIMTKSILHVNIFN